MEMKFLVIRRTGEGPFVVWEESDLSAGDVYDGVGVVVESVISLCDSGLHQQEINQLDALLSFDDVRRLLLHALDAAYLQGRRDQRVEVQCTLRGLIGD